MARPSIRSQQKQFAIMLLSLVVLFGVIFSIWYYFERSVLDGENEAAMNRAEEARLIPGDDLDQFGDRIGDLARLVAEDGIDAVLLDESFRYYDGVVGDFTELNAEDGEESWQAIIGVEGTEVVEEEVNGNSAVLEVENGQGRFVVRMGFEINGEELALKEMSVAAVEFEEEFGGEVGQKLPENLEFEAVRQGEVSEVNLGEADGKWKLLFFYPGDFTKICPTECLAIFQNIERFEEMNVQPYGISTDFITVHQAWDEYYFGGIPYFLVADPKRELTELFGFFSREENVTLRGTVIVDEENRIRFVSVQENDTGRNIEEYFRLLKAMQTPGLTPVNWIEGEQVLE